MTFCLLLPTRCDYLCVGYAQNTRGTRPSAVDHFRRDVAFHGRFRLVEPTLGGVP